MKIKHEKKLNNWCSQAQRFSLVFGNFNTALRNIKEYVFMHHEVYYCGIKIPPYDLTFFVSTNFPKAWRYVQIFIMDTILMVLQKKNMHHAKTDEIQSSELNIC